ncbi:MAG: TetR/AcrR family transcriptional regulator [Gammaproteobacteria bacterium]|nr:TetR/AcrR family transcriptional regulator [Gammaproteobacteria bacterium]
MRATSQSEPRLTQAERTEISDQRMFEATVQLIVEHGPAATSLKDVGVQAGYSRGLASHRFGNKDNLFSFTLRKVGEIWLRQLKQATSGHTGLAAVEKALDQHYRFCADAPDYVRTFYTLWFESVNSDSELRDAIRHIHQRRHQDVVQWILNDPTINESVKSRADDIAGQFGASVSGIVYYWLVNPEDLEQTKTLHDGLKHTMTQLLTENHHE